MIPGFIRERQSWQEAVDGLISRIDKDGYVSIYNWGLTIDIIEKLHIVDANVFLVVEGIAEHIIINKAGAEAVKKNLIKEQAYIIREKKHNRILMNNVALKQVEVLIAMFNAHEKKVIE